MKYTKKIKKHLQFISDKNYLQDCASSLSTLKCASALLEGLCCHFFMGEKPIERVNEVKKIIFSLIAEEVTITTEQDVNFYSNVLSCLCAYANVTKNSDAIEVIERVANPLINAFAIEFEKIKNQTSPLEPAKVLCALNPIFDYYLLTGEKDVENLLIKVVSFLPNIDFSQTKDNCFDYLTLCFGALKACKKFDLYAVNEPIARLFDNFMLKAQSLNYASAISFENKKETSAHATARSLEVALCLFENLKDERYLSLARRIWFNGMQFCQRSDGQVGSDVFTCEQTPNLKVIKYEIKQTATPLFAIGLKCYFTNKELFEERGELFKDRRGRYFIGDKMFGRDQSGFFGRDLIEIPTLTAFEKETALILDFKIIF